MQCHRCRDCCADASGHVSPTLVGSLYASDYLFLIKSYIPNRPQASGYQTNVSTYTLEYSRSDAQSFLNSMYNTQILGYNTSSLNSRDSQYGVCMACALVERRRQAANITRTSQCNACMQQYCYDAAPSNSTSSLTALGLVSPYIQG